MSISLIPPKIIVEEGKDHWFIINWEQLLLVLSVRGVNLEPFLQLKLFLFYTEFIII